jgi:DNA methylase
LAHSYLTKVPEEAIIPFIHNFTNPGDVIADCFAGSGMTGVAALLTGRNALLSDISKLGQHIGKNYVVLVDKRELSRLGDFVVDTARGQYPTDYETACTNCGESGIIKRVVWSEVFVCPECATEVVFYKAAFDAEKKVKKPKLLCDNGHPFVKKKSQKVREIPVEVHYTCSCSKTIIERAVNDLDLEHIKAIDGRAIIHWWPDIAFNHDTEMFSRSALAKNSRTGLGDFFSKRNLNMLAVLWEAINHIEESQYREKLRFTFTAILSRASKRYQWGPSRPLNAQNQTYYIAPVFYEWNVLDLFRRKLDAIIAAMEFIEAGQQRNSKQEATLWSPQEAESLYKNTTSFVHYVIASAHKLEHIPSESIDYVFTDSPFGSNIFYSDMNFFAEAWLNIFTDPTYEAVVRTVDKSKNTISQYEDLLSQAIKEIHRILKPGAWASIVFSNSSGKVWSTFQRAIKESGFITEDTQISILDKGQRSVKGLASVYEHIVTIDLVLTLHKATVASQHEQQKVKPLDDLPAIVDEIASSCIASGGYQASSSHLYLAVIRKCLKDHIDVENVDMAHVVRALEENGYTLNAKNQIWERTDTGTRAKVLQTSTS